MLTNLLISVQALLSCAYLSPFVCLLSSSWFLLSYLFIIYIHVFGPRNFRLVYTRYKADPIRQIYDENEGIIIIGFSGCHQCLPQHHPSKHLINMINVSIFLEGEVGVEGLAMKF
jgi:hypothetical protein